MTIIIIVTVLVLLVSLYDYFSSRSWQQVTSSSRNEVVFDERNKEYGAYEIRRNYDKTLILIMLGLAVSIGVAYGVYLFIKSLPEEVPPPPPVIEFIPVAPPIEEQELPPPPPEPEMPPMEKSIAFPPPVITDDVVDTKVPTQDELQDTKSSTVTNEEDNVTFDPPEVKQTVVQKEPDEILTFVAEEASFPGGTAEMMKYLNKNIRYPEIAIQANIQGRVTLRFVVGKDGEIENVSVVKGVPGCPECDKEAIRVVKSMPKWKPAKNDGKVVRSYFNLPVTFKLQ